MEARTLGWHDAWRAWWRAGRDWVMLWWQLTHLGAQLLALLITPSTYARAGRARLARHLYLDTMPLLPGFMLTSALISLVLIRIVVVTAQSYGLTHHALGMVVRVLVLELIPLTAALYAALRCTLPNGAEITRARACRSFERQRAEGTEPLRTEVLPRFVSGVFAVCTLAAASSVIALVLAYVTLYGLTSAALAGYTRTVGHVFTPAVSLIFGLKTLAFAVVVTLVPADAALRDLPPRRARSAPELLGVVRLLALVLLIEVVALVGSYH